MCEVRMHVSGRRETARSEQGCCQDGSISVASAGSKYETLTGSSSKNCVRLLRQGERIEVEAKIVKGKLQVNK